MALVTVAEAKAAARHFNVRTAETELRRFATSEPIDKEFDIFLSHSYLDAQVILGVKLLLERTGLSVYVDWIEDRQLVRNKVTSETADVLRRRMRNCNSLIYATSENSEQSKWMPWELGFFDGHRPGRTAIMPLVKSAGDGFEGQEYLGLYPRLEDVPDPGTTHSSALSLHVVDGPRKIPIYLFTGPPSPQATKRR